MAKKTPKIKQKKFGQLRRDVRQNRDTALLEAFDAIGSVSETARQLQLGQSTVSQWNEVPWNHVLTLEKLSGVSRYKLRPDIYPKE